MTQDTVEARLARVERSLLAGDALGAEQLLGGLLAAPDALASEATWRRALGALSRVAKALSWPAELRSALAAATGGGATALAQAGDLALTARRPAVAAGLLGRAVSLAPGRVAPLTNLVSALEQLGRHDAALRALQAAPEDVTAGFLPRYLEAFDRIMTGDLDGARAIRAGLDPAGDDRHGFMTARLDGVFARADAVTGITPLDAADVRGWHYVISGSLLLLVPPDGEDGATVARGGRYLRLEDGLELLFASAQVLEGLFDGLSLATERVIAVDEAPSRVTAAVVGGQLVAPVEADLVTEREGLVCAYDFAGLAPDLISGLRRYRPGQLTFAHLAPYRAEQRFAPDVIGALYGTRDTPWIRELPLPLDPFAEAALAGRALDTMLAPDWALDGLGDLMALAAVAQACGALPWLAEAPGQREPLWVGGPVPLPG